MRTKILVLLATVALALGLWAAFAQIDKDLPPGAVRNEFPAPCPNPEDALGNPIPKDGDINGDDTDDWLIGTHAFFNAVVDVWCVDGPFAFYAVTVCSGPCPIDIRFVGGCLTWGDGRNAFWKAKDADGNLTHTVWSSRQPGTGKAFQYTYDVATKKVTVQKYKDVQPGPTGGTKDGAPEVQEAPTGSFANSSLPHSHGEPLPTEGSCGVPEEFGVGGVAEPVALSGEAPASEAGGSGPGAGLFAGVAGGLAAVAAVAVALGGGWSVRRARRRRAA